MSTESGTADTGSKTKARIGRGRRIFRVVLIGIVVSAALLLAFPPFGLIKDTLAKNIGDTIGRTVTIGDMSVSLNPFLTAEFSDVRVLNPEGMPERDLFRADTLRTTVEFFPLLKGRVRMASLALINPTFALEEGADGARNWVLGSTDQGVQATAPAPVAANVSPPPVTTVENGTVSYMSAVTGGQYGAEQVNGTVLLDLVSGAGSSKGSLVALGETVTFDVALGDFDAPLNGNTSSLKAAINGRLVRANLDGDANFQSDAEFKGGLSASTPSLVDFIGWAGGGGASGGEPLKTSKEIVGDATNPLVKARRIFRWMSENIPWVSEREYSTIPSLSLKALDARCGDCGVQNTTFITLCRAAGIPARWQSGFGTKPGELTMHDWSEIHIEPWGWIPTDATQGIRQSDDLAVQEFFCGHMEPYRFIVNLDYGRELQPPKTSFRSEPIDFQRGEVEVDGHNLYYNDWNWDFDVKTTPGKPSS